MWLCVDRMEFETVLLMDDDEKMYALSADAYTALTGCPPREGDMVEGTVTDGVVTAAVYDPAETEARAAAARERLHRLFKRTGNRR